MPESGSEDNLPQDSQAGGDSGAPAPRQADSSGISKPPAQATPGSSEPDKTAQPDWVPPAPPGALQKIAQKLEPNFLKTMIDKEAIRRVFGKVITQKEDQLREQSDSVTAAPPKPKVPIEKYRKASPCQSSWDQMSGADRYRLCDKCKLFAYNFESMDLQEVEDLLFKREGRKDLAFYRRQDGKFLIRDCPVGLKQKNTTRLAIAAGVGFAVAALISFVVARPSIPPTVSQGQGSSSSEQPPASSLLLSPNKSVTTQTAPASTQLVDPGQPLMMMNPSQPVGMQPPAGTSGTQSAGLPSANPEGLLMMVRHPQAMDMSGSPGTTANTTTQPSPEQMRIPPPVPQLPSEQNQGTGTNTGAYPGQPVRQPASPAPAQSNQAGSPAFNQTATPQPAQGASSSQPYSSPYVKQWNQPSSR